MLRTFGPDIPSSKKKVGRMILGRYTSNNWVDNLLEHLTAPVRAHEWRGRRGCGSRRKRDCPRPSHVLAEAL